MKLTTPVIATSLAAAAAIPAVNIMTNGSDEPVEVACDLYDFRAILNVPQVVNNMESQGLRRYERQKIKGTLFVGWMSDGNFVLGMRDVQNLNFRVGGKSVTYEATVGNEESYTRFNFIGNNRTGQFRTPAISFNVELFPSYALSEANEDNSLYLLFAGKGTSLKKGDAFVANYFSGNVSGIQGCGCTDYGHKSPTRVAKISGPGEEPEDVVPTFGTWTARWKSRVTN